MESEESSRVGHGDHVAMMHASKEGQGPPLKGGH
jgi:hypothetical protein